MRDRLIELLENNPTLDGMDGTSEDFAVCADYLLANGVIVPPVKLGQTLFAFEDIGIQILPEIIPLTVYNLAFTVFEDGTHTHIVCITERRKVRHVKYEDFGKTIFPTKEEAERALEGGEG